MIAPPAGGSVFEKLAGKGCGRIEREGPSSLVCFGATTKRDDRHVHFSDEPTIDTEDLEETQPIESTYIHRLEVREAARGNFCRFHRLELRDFRQMLDALDLQIAGSALGTTGWAFTRVRDWNEFDLDPIPFDDHHSCVSFNHEPNNRTPETAAEIARARADRAVRNALGPDAVRLLQSMGAYESVAAQVEANLITTEDDELEVFGVDTWVDVEIEITLDSGCCEHVMDLGDAPGYAGFIGESSGSKRKQNFIVGNGQKVPNEGQLVLNLESDLGGSKRRHTSTFQVAEVTRPLMSVSRVCDQGMRCIFEDTHALIVNKSNGKEVTRFERVGGLYVARMKLKPPEGFSGPAR